MHRIKQKFKDLRQAGKKGFIPYIVAGDPSLQDTEDIVLQLEEAGSDIVELGIPFSDPLADGRVNQMGAERGLASGTTLAAVLKSVERIRQQSEIPLVIYSYLNPLHQYGFEKFARRAAKVGVDGVLIVDLSIVESKPYRKILNTHHIDNICLVTPTTPDKRIAEIVKVCTGFVYTVSREGVTGAQQDLQQNALTLLDRVHQFTNKPVALGFGVSTPEQARAYAEITEAVVVGSFVVDTLHRLKRPQAIRKIKDIINAVKEV